MRDFSILPLVLTLLAINACTHQDTKDSVQPPNFVIIFADDLGYGDIGCFGANDINTPNIDRIATKGIKFTDFYSAAHVCSPSRAALLTGRYPQRMGIANVFFPESFTGMPIEEITIADRLKEAGYTSGVFGKWHLGHHEKFLPLQRGFDSYFGIPYSNDMETLPYIRDNEVVTYDIDQKYSTQKFTEEALAFIDENKANPFFLYLPYSMPHVPIYASENFEGTSQRGLYGDVIQELDWGVGQIIKRLEENGILENTLIVFSSDNGPWLVMEDLGGSNGGLREGKQFTFDGGMRVPTVAMWKGKIPPGTVVEELATQMDWFPTLLNLANLHPSPDVIIDGKDISDVLMGTGKRKGDRFLFYDGMTLEAYREGNWKLKLPYSGFEGAWYKSKVDPHDTLLINLKDNTAENINLISENRDIADRLLENMYLEDSLLGDFPPSLVVRLASDSTHFHYLRDK